MSNSKVHVLSVPSVPAKVHQYAWYMYFQVTTNITAAGCRTRSDSVRVVETLITASPEFFQSKTSKETNAFFERALEFIVQKQSMETIISAVVHMDEAVAPYPYSRPQAVLMRGIRPICIFLLSH